MPPREWNAASYDRMSDPQLAMARDVIDRLDLRGDERGTMRRPRPPRGAWRPPASRTSGHLERIPVGDHEAFVAAVLDRLGEPVVANYVRLNILVRT
jgi:hypothetical protein